LTRQSVPSGKTPDSTPHLLAEGLAAMQLALPQSAQAQLIAYLDLLTKWNRVYNLTAVRDPVQMVSRHLLDSLAVLPFVGHDTLADLGSGAGLPGVPLAIARPDLRVTLIESNGKKARFLREVIRSLRLANTSVVEARGQAVQACFGTITTRALASLAEMLALGGHLLACDGRWLALKGRKDPNELAAVPAGFRVRDVYPVSIPELAAERCVIEIVYASVTDTWRRLAVDGSQRTVFGFRP
jgi:16S rRNA (guanine527-N7)-methyltransferase